MSVATGLQTNVILANFERTFRTQITSRHKTNHGKVGDAKLHDVGQVMSDANQKF